MQCCDDSLCVSDPLLHVHRFDTAGVGGADVSGAKREPCHLLEAQADEMQIPRRPSSFKPCLSKCGRLWLALIDRGACLKDATQGEPPRVVGGGEGGDRIVAVRLDWSRSPSAH